MNSRARNLDCALRGTIDLRTSKNSASEPNKLTRTSLSRLLLLTVPIIFTAPAERPVGRAPGIEKQSKPCMQSKLHEVYPNKA